jgi:hypothetical protein
MKIENMPEWHFLCRNASSFVKGEGTIEWKENINFRKNVGEVLENE